MSSPSDNNSQAIKDKCSIAINDSSETDIIVENISANQIDMSDIYGTKLKTKLWKLNYHPKIALDDSKQMEELRSSGTDNLVIRGCSMYSHRWVQSYHYKQGERMTRLTGYFADDFTPEQESFQNVMNKIVSRCDTQTSTGKKLSHPIGLVRFQWNRITFNISDKTKFYDSKGIIIDRDSLQHKPFNFVPVFHIESVLFSKDSNDLIISLLGAIVSDDHCCPDSLKDLFRENPIILMSSSPFTSEIPPPSSSINDDKLSPTPSISTASSTAGFIICGCVILVSIGVGIHKHFYRS